MKVLAAWCTILLCFSSVAKKEGAKSRFEQLELFNRVLYLVEKEYYREVDSEKLIHGAIKGMMETLDPHSNFLPSDIFEKMKSDTQGEFGGLGIEVTVSGGRIYVIAPIEDTPAFEAGIKSGDKIVEIDGAPTIGLALEDAIKKMKGEPGTEVTLTILRAGEDEKLYVTIEREIIKINPVKATLLSQHYGLLRLKQFSKGSSKDLMKALTGLKKQSPELRGLILDLRANPGGLLTEAVKVASIFLDDGVVVSTEGRDPTEKEIHYVHKNIEKELKLPLVVLIDGASASASEIVAGALKDRDRAILMGRQSFGKGSVQQVAKIDGANGAKLTIAQYMTPNGNKIQAKGIAPDIKLEQYDSSVLEKHRKDPSYTREVDLKNHLNATIETPEEKRRRLERERQARKRRIEKLKMKREAKRSDGDSAPAIRRYNPEFDYQVKTAVNVLKGFNAMPR